MNKEKTRISWSGLTQDIKMISCVFQCDIPHQWKARQVGPLSVYCDGVGCHVQCLRHGIHVWQYIGQSTTTTSRHRHDITSDVKTSLNPQQTNSCFSINIKPLSCLLDCLCAYSKIVLVDQGNFPTKLK